MTLDATVAGASADSYLTVGAADALAARDMTEDPEVTGWLGGTSAESKEAALRRATRQLEAAITSGFRPYVATQALLFPRSVDFTVNGTVATPYVPMAIQRACYEQAKYLLKNAATIARGHTRQARAMQSASEPNISYTQAAPDGAGELSPGALQYLGRFMREGGGGLRSIRMSSGSSYPPMGWELR